MKAGTILRGSSYDEHNANSTNSKQIIKEEILDRIQKATDEAKNNLDEAVHNYKTMFHEKLNDLDEYKISLEENFNNVFNENELKFSNFITTFEDDKATLMKSVEDSLSEFMDTLEKDIKEMTLTLFEKFFFTQYQDMDNLNSLINNMLVKLEDSKNIHISLSENYFDKFKEDKIQEFNKLLDRNVQITSHSKESLICEFKTDEGNIEIDYDKQMEKLKNILNEF